MTDRHSEIKSSYKQLGGIGSVYDGIITRSTLLGKLMDSLEKRLGALYREVSVHTVNAEGIFHCEKACT